MSESLLFLEELKTESERDLEIAKLLLKTDYIEEVAWHIEQAYEKIVMYGCAQFKVHVQGRGISGVTSKLRETHHTEKHHLVLNLLLEMSSSLGQTLNQKSKQGSLGPDQGLPQEATKFASRMKNKGFIKKYVELLEHVRDTTSKDITDTKSFENLIAQSTLSATRSMNDIDMDVNGASEPLRERKDA